jgi:hypothetical protein
MRIKVGIISADLCVLASSSPTYGLLIIRTDQDMMFYSTARVVSYGRFIGTLHTDWITVPSAVNRYFSELRGKTLQVKLQGTCNSAPGGSPVQATLVAGGAEGGRIVQQVRAFGSFERSLDARAGWFIRTTPSVSHLPVTRPCAERLNGVLGLLGSGLNVFREGLDAFR